MIPITALYATILALGEGNHKFADDDGGWVPPLDTYQPKLYKANRNDPCPCNSGKKFKRCCISKTVGKPIKENAK